MSRLFDDLTDALGEVEDFLDGKESDVRIHLVEIDPPKVRIIREQSGLSQSAFADSIGVSVGTLRGWEQGRRHPQGAARVLLAMLAKRPTLVQEVLGSDQKA